MIANHRQFRLTGNGARRGAPRLGLLGKILTTVASAGLLVAGLMFSFLIFATAAAIALPVVGYVWWKTRPLRHQLRERAAAGRVIDGEVIRDVEPQEPIQR